MKELTNGQKTLCVISGKDIVCCIELCNDLVAEEVKYHTNCMTKFHLKDGTDKRRGWPEGVQMVKGFERVCIWLE